MSKRESARGPVFGAASGSPPGAAPEFEALVVLVSGPDADGLLALGRTLVEERLAACVNVLGGIRSVYRWAGTVEEAGEALALVKTTAPRLEALADRIRELHPFDEPEVLALPVVGGSPSYLAWVAEGVRHG